MSSASENMPAAMPKNADPRLRPAPPGGVSLNMLIFAGALSATIFGSRVVLQEIQSAPDMMGYAAVRHVGMIWDDAMRRIRATAPDGALHDAVRKAEAARF